MTLADEEGVTDDDSVATITDTVVVGDKDFTLVTDDINDDDAEEDEDPLDDA